MLSINADGPSNDFPSETLSALANVLFQFRINHIIVYWRRSRTLDDPSFESELLYSDV